MHWHLVGHAVVTMPPGGGIDASARVSAVAAVIQAAGAIVSIWVAWKAARTAEAREAALAEQVRTDRAAAFNRPIDRAVDLGELVLRDLTDLRDQYVDFAAKGDGSLFSFGMFDSQTLLAEQLPQIRMRTDDVHVSSEMKSLQGACAHTIGPAFTAGDWVPKLEARIRLIDGLLNTLRGMRR